MARFIAEEIERGFVKPVTTDQNVVIMNSKGTVNFSFCRTKVKIYSHVGRFISEHLCQRGVTISPNGAQVLPYYKHNQEYYVVLVEQFRIAVPAQTLECPGGEADIDDIQAVMAKELEEEAQINLDPKRIKVVFRELIQPSIINAWAYGGIVELKPAEVKNRTIGGEWQFGEFTAVVVKPLLEMLRLRDSGKHNLDLWGSRLLDEVAKETGLLKRCYQKGE